MSKHLLSVMALVMTMMFVSGCENPVTSTTDFPAEQQEEVKYKTVNFNVSGFEVTSEYITTTRADKALSEISTLTNLQIVLFKGNDSDGYTKAYTFQQTSSDTGYGKISAFVAYGTYKVVVVANGGNDYYAIDSPTSVSVPTSMERVKDTLTYVYDLTVSESSATDQSILLKRAVAIIGLKITEAYAELPTTFDHFKMELKGGSTVLNPISGFGTGNATQTIEEKYNNNSTNVTLGIYTFPTSGNTLEFTVHAIDKSGNVMRTYTFNDFTLTADVMTTYNGKFFADNESFTIAVDENSASWTTVTKQF